MSSRLSLLVGGLLLAAVMTAAAQDGPRFVRVNVVTVKPDKVDEFITLHRDTFTPALKKAGVPSRNVWRTAEFGNTFEFTIVSPIASFADYDAPSPLSKVLSEGELDRALTTWSECVTGRTSYALRERPDLSFFTEGDWAPKMAVVVTLTIAPGKNQAFETLLKNEVLPAMQKAGIKAYLVNQFVFGGSGLQYSAVTLIDNFAELDEGPPLVRALGVEGAAKLQARSSGIVQDLEITVMEHMAELSY